MKKIRITAIIDQRLLKVVSDGTRDGTKFVGLESDINRIRAAAFRNELIEMGDIGEGVIARAGYDTPIGMLAAIYAVAPQSTHIYHASDELKELVSIGNTSPNGVVISIAGKGEEFV